MKKAFIFFLFFFVLSLGFAERKVGGIVFLDANNNNVLDKGEKGLANVPVSDGKQIILTDRRGHYFIQTDEDEPIIFISFPSGYFTDKFWRKVKLSDDSQNVNFSLYKVNEKTPLFIIQVTDIHSTFSDACYRDVGKFVEEANEFRPDFIVATGDLVMDANPLKNEEDVIKFYQLYKELMKNLKRPLFNLPGNHEHPWSIPQTSPLYDRGAYKEFLGPVYYSFNYSGWHLVMLEATTNKKSGFDDEQLDWLEKDLSLAKDKPTIIFTHQPPFECDNFLRFLAIINQNPQVKIVFSGHEHSNVQLPLGRILNILTGALSGSWWGDEKPNLDGTPRGYRLILADKGEVLSCYKWVGERHSVDVANLIREAVLKGKSSLTIKVFDTSDNIKGIAIRIDNKPPLIFLQPSAKNVFWKTYDVLLDTTQIPNGEHTLTFYAVSRSKEDGKRVWKMEYPVKVENQ